MGRENTCLEEKMTKLFSRRAEWFSCPNPECSWHFSGNIPSGLKWYRCHGYYDSAQHGKVPRYVCLRCGKTFSERAADSDYYLHFDGIDIKSLGKAWLAGETLREIAREYGITIQMVRTRLKRLSFDEQEP